MYIAKLLSSNIRIYHHTRFVLGWRLLVPVGLLYGVERWWNPAAKKPASRSRSGPAVTGHLLLRHQQDKRHEWIAECIDFDDVYRRLEARDSSVTWTMSLSAHLHANDQARYHSVFWPSQVITVRPTCRRAICSSSVSCSNCNCV